MAKQAVPLIFTIVDPNPPKVLERKLQAILLDKLLTWHRENIAVGKLRQIRNPN